MRISFIALLFALVGCTASRPTGETAEIRIPTGAGGVGFLPLLVMEKYHLIEEQAKKSGLDHLHVQWINLGGPAVMNDALLSGSVDFIAAGPPAFLTLWDKTRDSSKVMGVAAMASLPMYLNTTASNLKSPDDLTAKDKIAVTAIKVSIPATLLQMYAEQKHGSSQVTRFDKFTVTMTHPDAMTALLAASGGIDAHFTSPPFHQREIKDARIRTIMTSDDIMGSSTTFTMISTTAAFREHNPKVYAAVLAALDQANQKIVADKHSAAELLAAAAGDGGLSANEIVDVLGDPAIKFTTTPENVMKYAGFMHRIGSLQHVPDSWKDLFFPEVHGAPGS
jgi:NitT/TauT family transport system substrate-binding protein